MEVEQRRTCFGWVEMLGHVPNRRMCRDADRRDRQWARLAMARRVATAIRRRRRRLPPTFGPSAATSSSVRLGTVVWLSDRVGRSVLSACPI